MTLLDPHLDVDQVSAAVDGERDPAVAAHLLVCLSCREQVDAWRRVLSSMADVPALAPDFVDRMVDRALARSDAPTSGLDAAPRGLRLRPRWSSRLPGWASVAAVLILAVTVAGAVIALHHSPSTTVASGEVASRQPATGSHEPSGKSSGITAGPASGATNAPLPAVGGTAQLTAQLRRLTPSLHPAVLSARTPCLHGATLLAAKVRTVSDDAPWYDETVQLDGAAARAFVFQGAAGYVAVVVRSDTCTLLATLSF